MHLCIRVVPKHQCTRVMPKHQCIMVVSHIILGVSFGQKPFLIIDCYWGCEESSQ